MLQRFSPIGNSHADDAQGFDLREIINFLWRQWKFIASVVAVSLLVGAVILAREIPRYTATTLILLDPRKEKAAGAEAFISDVTLDYAMIESQMAIIRSTVFMRRVVERERLTADPEFGSAGASAAPAQESARPASTRSSSGAPHTAADIQATPPHVMGSIEALKGATSVGRAGQGYVLAISVTSVDPVRAARLANAVSDAFVLDKLDARFEAAQRASGWLSDRLAELRRQLRESEEAVAHFRAEHGLTQASANLTLNQQQLSDLNVKLIAARADTAEKKARLGFLKSMESKGGNIQNLPDTLSSTSLASLRQQERAVAQKETDLASRYANNHPQLVNARAERRDVQLAIVAEMHRLLANIENDYELAKSREDALERTLKEATGQLNVDDMTSIKLRELERTAAVNRALFEDFLQKAKLTQEQSTFEAREARVISPALPPGAPSYPQKGRTMAIALLIGLMLGVGGAMAKERLNSGFTTPRQVEEMLELPLLSSASRMDARDLTVDGKIVPIPLYPAIKPLSRFSEAMRALRSGIQMTDVDNPPKVIQLTSTVPGEGKTTIALSLAVSAANSGLKVLFIDGDLRHPSASRFLGLHKDIGLVDLLLGDATPQQVVRYWEAAKFWTLSAGSKTQNPPDLLGSERMKLLIENFKSSFDYVVIDTPPVGPVVDPLVVSRLADKVVYVVRWASTARELVQNGVRQLSGHKKIAGIMFNLLNEGQAQKYGTYAYHYGSRYYRKYYGEEG